MFKLKSLKDILIILCILCIILYNNKIKEFLKDNELLSISFISLIFINILIHFQETYLK